MHPSSEICADNTGWTKASKKLQMKKIKKEFVGFFLSELLKLNVAPEYEVEESS